jgi:peptidyl-prolyl cis-trans isomerase C
MPPSKKNVLWLFLFLACLVLTNCGRGGEDVIAKVNGAKLTLEDLYAEIPLDYYDSVTLEQKRDFIERWINSEVLYQEAMRRGLQRQPETKERLRSSEKNILISELIQQEMSVRTQVSEEEAQAYYRTHTDEFTRQQDEMRASQILVATLEEANAIRRQIESGADFSRLARERSSDPSSVQGGDLGYFTREDLLSEISKAVFSTTPGTLLKPIKTEFGYHILLVTDFQKAGTIRPFELVQEEIIGRLSREKEQQELDAFLQELRESSSIVRNEEALGAELAAQKQEAEER